MDKDWKNYDISFILGSSPWSLLIFFLKKSSEREIYLAATAFGEAAADENRSDARFEQAAESNALAILRPAEVFKRAARFIQAAEV